MTHELDKVCQLVYRCNIDQLYIAIPLIRPPWLAGPSLNGEPVEDDGDHTFAGDHDLHASVELLDAVDWNGHQKYAVYQLVEETLDNLNDLA